MPDCSLRIPIVSATIRHPHTGEWVDVEAEKGSPLANEIARMMIRSLDRGLGRDRPRAELAAPSTTRHDHPLGHCPMCAHLAAPGPRLWGLWLVWPRPGSPLPLRNTSVEELANADAVAAQVAGWYEVRQQTTHAATVGGLVVPADAPPRLDTRLVDEGSQMWLWRERPAGEAHQWWPERVLLCADGQVQQLSGDEAHRRMLDQARRLPTPTPSESSTRTLTVGGVRVRVLTDSRGDRVVSLLDPRSSTPARRVLADGRIEHLAGSQPGLTLLGRTHIDRPPVAQLGQWLPAYQGLVDELMDAAR